MRLFLLSLISVSFFTFGLTVNNAGEEKVETKKYSTTVKLSINVSPSIKSPEETKNIENQFYSYFSRELRSLGDVNIGSDNPNWIFKIMVLPARNSNRIIYYIEIVRRFEISNLLLSVVDKAFKTKEVEQWSKYNEKRLYLEKEFSEIFRITGDDKIHVSYEGFLHEDNLENVPSFCRYIVAHFDAKNLKIERDVWQKMSDEKSETVNELKK